MKSLTSLLSPYMSMVGHQRLGNKSQPTSFLHDRAEAKGIFPSRLNMWCELTAIGFIK